MFTWRRQKIRYLLECNNALILGIKQTATRRSNFELSRTRVWVAIVTFRECGLWPREFMTSNFVEESAAQTSRLPREINGTVISVAVVVA